MTAYTTTTKTGFAAILQEHLRRYPALQLTDIYKLVHQASLGSEHAVSDREAAQCWLEQELALLGEGPAEPVHDPISSDGRILRIHLRPFLAGGGDPGFLLKAFLRTANEFRGSLAKFQAYWATVERLAAQKRLPFRRAVVQEFGRAIAAQGYPAVHHSAAYSAAYRPAYRVVTLDFLLNS